MTVHIQLPSFYLVPENLFGFNLPFFSALILQRHKSGQLAPAQWHIWSSTSEEQPGYAATGRWAGKREISSLQMRDDSCPQVSCKIRFGQTHQLHTDTQYRCKQAGGEMGFVFAVVSSCICSILEL